MVFGVMGEMENLPVVNTAEMSGRSTTEGSVCRA